MSKKVNKQTNPKWVALTYKFQHCVANCSRFYLCQVLRQLCCVYLLYWSTGNGETILPTSGLRKEFPRQEYQKSFMLYFPLLYKRAKIERLSKRVLS